MSNSYEYTKSSEEINARFAQVLMDLSNMNVTSKNMITYIKAVFKHHSLFKELFDDYPDGQKKYNQLLKRAYKFCKEINNYEKFNHNELPRQTIKQMIKNIISKI